MKAPITVGLATSSSERASELRRVVASIQGMERVRSRPRRPAGDVVLVILRRWFKGKYPDVAAVQERT